MVYCLQQLLTHRRNRSMKRIEKRYTYKCSICGKPIKGLGNDPRPIRENKDDWCCDECDKAYVQPTRRLFDCLNTFARNNDVILRFADYYMGVRRRFDCWEYWISKDYSEDNIDEGVFDDSFAPLTQVIKDLLDKHHISPSGFELLEPDPYEMIEYVY